jgi:hypothetical protein
MCQGYVFYKSEGAGTLMMEASRDAGSALSSRERRMVMPSGYGRYGCHRLFIEDLLLNLLLDLSIIYLYMY